MSTPDPDEDSDSPFADYHFLSLPDLSTLRHPQSSRQLLSVRIDPDASIKVILVALARCLGAYCGASDVLLAWHPQDSPTDSRVITAIRVNWTNSSKYEDVLNNLILRNSDDNPSSIRSTLGIEIDDGLQPFLAILTSDLEYNHPLLVSVESKPNGSEQEEQILHLKYSTRHFHASSAELLAKQVAVLTARIAQDPASSPKYLDFLPDELLSIVPMRTDGTSYTHYPPASNIIEFIKRHDPATVEIEYYPDLHLEEPGAVEQSVQLLTFGDLDKRSNRFAAYLLAQGLELEDRVTICMPRGIEYHVAIIGVLRAGGCYVPIDDELPKERQDFINEDSGARFTLTAENIEEHITASESYPDDDVNNTRSDGLAYMLYTSGTTGAPKGCLLKHDGFAQAIHALSWFANQAGPNKRRWPQAGRYLCVASVAFDVHLAEIFVALSLGMTLICAPRSQLFEDLPCWLHRLHITHVGIVPSLIEATMHAVAESIELAVDDDGTGVKNKTMDLAYIASGGEKMSDSILDKWADSPLVTLANFYGPSETTIGCSAHLMTSATRKENIGRIFESCSAYVVDENLNPVVRGGVGELLVGGRLVGRGYHSRPDLTAKAFIEFSHGPHRERVYRTGDLATVVRLMPDDTMEILGRIDTQIKLRGVRIESEGVSSVIRNAAVRFPGLHVKNAPDVSTILARHPQLKTDQLVSFIGLDSTATIAHRRSTKPSIYENVPRGLMHALKEACTRELASYMRPAHVVPLDFIPLNQNGKTDNKVLSALFQCESLETLSRAGAQKGDHHVNGVESSRSLNELEVNVAEIICKYAEVRKEQLIPSSNLFQLGFDSVKLVRLASEFRSLCNARSLSVGTIIQHPTIEGLATLLEGAQGPNQGKSSVSRVEEFAQQWRPEVEETYGAEKIEKALPTFPVQDGVLYRSADLKTLYIQHVLLRVHGGVDIEKLKSAWTALMAQHEILRTVFHYSSSLVQVVLKAEACDLPWLEREVQADSLEELQSTFFKKDALVIARSINENISTSPAFRLVWYRLEEQETSLLAYSLHHAIYDGISLPLLLHDVETLYLHESPRMTSPLAQVLDAVYDIDMDEAAAFWKETFSEFDWSRIPRRLAFGEIANVATKIFRTGLSEWERNSAEIRVSLQAVLTAAFGICLGEQLYGVPDVVFGVIRSGRSFADDKLNEARAPLLTVVPTRVNAELGAELLQKVQNDIGAVLTFEHIPLSRVQTWVKPGRPLFEVLFSVSIDEKDTTELWDILESKQPQADYILAVEVVLDKKTGQIRIDCGYTAPLESHDVSRILDELENTARSLVEGKVRTEQKYLNGTKMYEQDTGDDSDTEDLPDGPVDEELQSKILSVVSQFLKIDESQILETSSLVALGLDSIKSVGLARALRKEGIEIRSLDIMRHPTIRRMASHSSQALGSQGAQSEESEQTRLLSEKRERVASFVDRNLLKLDDKDDVQLYPTTILQAGMLSQTISSGGQLYVHAFPFVLKKSIDINRLCGAWEKTVQYFSTLRTSFHYVENMGAWIQAVHSSYRLNWHEMKVPDGKTCLVLSEEFIKELDLSSERKLAEPPVFVRMLRPNTGASSTCTLLLVLHHALYDGISVSRLSEVVRTFYRDERPAPSPQFVDLLGYFEYQELHGTDFWARQLRGYKRPALRSKSGDGSHTGTVSSSADVPLSATRMSKACEHFEVTVQCFGQAALATALAKVYNRRDLVYGHVVSGRSVPHAEDVLGPMISTLPCRSNIPAGIRNLDFVRTIHRQNMAAQRWQHASLRSIHRKVGLSSLWDTIFLFQPIVDDTSDEEDAVWSFDESEDEIAKIQYPLNIELHQYRDLLIIKAASQVDFFDQAELEAIVQDFSQIFIRIVNEPLGIALPHLAIDDDGYHSLANGFLHDIMKRPQSTLADVRVSSFIAVLSACVEAPPNSIQPDTPLVSLGVDSITAIQVSSRAREAGLQLHAADVLRCQTPEDVIQILKSKTTQKDVQRRPNSRISAQLRDSIVRRLVSSKDLIEEILPASAGMEWLIGMWQVSNRERFQHVFAFELPNDIDEDSLKSAWCTLVQKHPILRSTFVSTTGDDVNVVTFKKLTEERLWSRRDLSIEHSATKQIEDIAKEMVSRPLSTDLPPCRAVLISSRGLKVLALHLHHFQYDAWSLRLLANDLENLYRGEGAIYGGNLSSFLENCNSEYFKDEQTRYWKSYLPSPFSPSLFPQRNKGVATERERLFYLDRQALRGISRFRQRAQELSSSLNVLFLASWAQVQAKLSSASSATFGLWHLGRSGIVDDIDSLPIPCMNVLPLHVDIPDVPVMQIADRIQKALRQRSAIVEQSHLLDVDHWSSGDGSRVIMNVFVNIVATSELENSCSDSFLKLIDLPYFIPKVKEREARPSAERLAICNLIEDAVLVDFVVSGDDVAMSVEYRSDYLDEEESRGLVTEWARTMEETLIQ
ncbi:hypothetical protein ACEPAF_4958 [Sanghuangporus sanghuang]